MFSPVLIIFFKFALTAGLLPDDYFETHKTVNTRNIYRMLLCCEKFANNARDN